MKITVVTSGSIRSNFTYRVLQLSRSLRKLGHEVSIICPIADKYNNFVPERITEIDGVKIIQPFQFVTKRLEINLIPYILHSCYILLTRKSDLIYIYKPTPISIVGLIPKIFYKTKVVLDMDDIGSEVMKIEGHPIYQRKMVEWSERLAIRYSDKIVAASTYLRDLFRSKHKDKPIMVVSNAVDSNWFYPLKISEVKNRIVFMGSINRKNILEPLVDRAKEIAQIIPDLKVVIIGDGNFLGYFKEKVKSLSLDNIFEFTGWLSLDEAREKLMAGDIGYNYMPDEVTTKSASNMKVPQYMARGVVPLVSNVGDLAKYIDYGSSGYICEPNNSELLKDCILGALNDPLRIEKANKAADFSKIVFNWDKLAKDFFDWVFDDKSQDSSNSVYFVSTTSPGNKGGTGIRNLGMISMLSRLGEFSIECFSILRDKNDAKIDGGFNNTTFRLINRSKGNVLRFAKSILINRLPPFFDDYKSSGIGEAFYDRCKNRLPKFVQIEQIHTYYCLRKYIPWLKSKGVKIIFDAHNIESKIFEDSLKVFSPIKRIVGKFLVSSYKKLEIEAVSNSDIIMCCSELDKKFFTRYNSNTYVVPNGINVDSFQASKVDSDSIIFIGGVAYPPNEDALKFYLSEIHPLVKSEISDYRFYIVGADKYWCNKNGFNDDAVVALGYVDDIGELLEKTSVGICPLRYGSGTRLKILTYLAASLPVVSTRKGAEGVDYVNGRDLILEDNPKIFAQEIVRLLKNKQIAKGLGENGKRYVRSNYDWSVIESKLSEVYKK